MNIKYLTSALNILSDRPPTFAADDFRTEAFLKIDKFLEASVRKGSPHDLKRSHCALANIVGTRLHAVTADIECAITKTDSVHIWQLYNSGVVVQIAGMTLGFDVVPFPRFFGWPEPHNITTRLASCIDALFITHAHADHFDEKFVVECLNAGKPVYMPKAAACEYDYDIVPVDDGSLFTLGKLQIRCRSAYHVWRETMDELPLAYYEVSAPGSFVFLFSGDADYTKSFRKTPGQQIDLLFLPWRNPNANYEDGKPQQIGTTSDAIAEALKRIQPRHLLLEHYAELDHIYNGFSPSYAMAVDTKRTAAVPTEWMFWGESIELPLVP